MNNSTYKKNITYIVMEGIVAAVILNLYNPYTQMFARRLGASDIYIALINSLPQLVAIFVLIPCSMFIERISNKKLVVCFLILINSLFYLIIAFVPFLPQGIKLISYVLFIGLMNWPASLYTTTWQSFFSYMFEPREANNIYSSRSKYGAFFGLLTALVSGYILSALPKSDNDRIFIYQVFYFICFLVSILQVFLLYRVQQDKQITNTTKIKSLISFNKKDFKEIFSNKRFMIYCGCSFAFYFAWQMGWPVFFLYNVDCIKANEFQLGLIAVASGFTSFLSYPLWNWLIAKKGNNFVIILGAFGLALNPFFFIKVIPIYSVIAINLFTGVAAAGFTLTSFCNLIEILPEDKKTVYISVFNTFLFISGFISPLIGIWINKYAGIFLTLAITGCLRLVTTGLFGVRWYYENKKQKSIINLEQ